MSEMTIRPAYSTWPEYNRRLRDVVAAMTDEQLAIRPAPDRWPLWATIGHAACQRVYWLCDCRRRARRGDDALHERRLRLPG